jgi:hypothetical protein
MGSAVISVSSVAKRLVIWRAPRKSYWRGKDRQRQLRMAAHGFVIAGQQRPNFRPMIRRPPLPLKQLDIGPDRKRRQQVGTVAYAGGSWG